MASSEPAERWRGRLPPRPQRSGVDAGPTAEEQQGKGTLTTLPAVPAERLDERGGLETSDRLAPVIDDEEPASVDRSKRETSANFGPEDLPDEVKHAMETANGLNQPTPQSIGVSGKPAASREDALETTRRSLEQSDDVSPDQLVNNLQTRISLGEPEPPPSAPTSGADDKTLSALEDPPLPGSDSQHAVVTRRAPTSVDRSRSATVPTPFFTVPTDLPPVVEESVEAADQETTALRDEPVVDVPLTVIVDDNLTGPAALPPKPTPARPAPQIIGAPISLPDDDAATSASDSGPVAVVEEDFPPQPSPSKGPLATMPSGVDIDIDEPALEPTATANDGIRELPPLDAEIETTSPPPARPASKPTLPLTLAPSDRPAIVAEAKPQLRPQPPAAKASPPPPPPQPPAQAARPAGPQLRADLPPIVAIDFGTSRSSAALVVDRNVHVLRLWNGAWDMASVVGFLENGSVVLDADAKRMLGTDPQNAIASPKRLMGRRYQDRELEPYLASLAMPHSQAPDGGVLLHAHGATYNISQVCAPVLYQLKVAAEQQLGKQVEEVVMTAPVSFDDRRYAALERAAGLAGLEVLEFVDEPTAAALTNRFDPSFNGLVAVYDFGGGTFDFSVVEASGADVQVVATAGDIWLGGDDFDEALANAAANAFWREHKIELRHQVVQWQRLLHAAEQTKRALSTRDSAVVEVRDVALTAAGQLHLSFPVSQAHFAELAAPIIERSFDTCRNALELSDIQPREISAVYLSGGTSYIPAVREGLGRFFGIPPKAAVPPERAVVTGAAIYAALLHMGSVSEE